MTEAYDEFMSNLTPCSSESTLCSFNDDFNELNVLNLQNQRTFDLKKSNTLVDHGYMAHNIKNIETELTPPDAFINVIDANTSEIIHVDLSEIKQFVNHYVPDNVITNDDYITINHLILYLYNKLDFEAVTHLKLSHLGKLYCIDGYAALRLKNTLTTDLNIDRFPTFHLVHSESTRRLNLSIPELLLQTCKAFEEQKLELPPGHMGAIYHKVRQMKHKPNNDSRVLSGPTPYDTNYRPKSKRAMFKFALKTLVKAS